MLVNPRGFDPQAAKGAVGRDEWRDEETCGSRWKEEAEEKRGGDGGWEAKKRR